MADATADSQAASGVDMVVVACLVDASLNRVPRVKLASKPRCGRAMSPNFEAAAAQLEPRVRMAKLDTEAEPGLAGRYGIQSIPSMIMIHKGREIARTAGAMPTAAIVQWVEQALARAG